MGIYDREYYRDGSRGFRFLGGDWSATKILVAINVAAFIAQWVTNDGRPGAMGGPFTDLFDASHDAIVGRGQVWRLLTYAFLHGSPLHLLFNMLFLWMAGREVEHIYGKAEFIRMYLAACVLAGLAWLAMDTFNSPGFLGSGSPMLGASGAVVAVLVVFAMYYPQREVLLFFILPIPMWLFVIVFLGLDLLGLLGELRGQGDAAIAFSAHLGGAAYGFLYKNYDLQWGHLGRWFSRGPRLKVYRPESPGRRVAPSVGVTSRAGSSKSAVGAKPGVGQYPDEHLDAKVDEILAKIAREGRSGLTDEENRILQEASLRAKSTGRATVTEPSIRQACPEDAPAIVAYNLALATETEDKSLDPDVLARGVSAALADPSKIRYWVAEHDGQVIGMAGVTFEWSDWRNGWIWWFQSVYVHPGHRGRGVLRAIFAAIRRAGAESGVIGWRLYVEQANHPAHKVYKALGLHPGGYDVYEDFGSSH